MTASQDTTPGHADPREPRTFGPNGRYTTRVVPFWAVEAVHTASGRRIGHLSWLPGNDRGTPHPQGSPDPSLPAVYKVVVSRPMRRKGFATAMLAHARDVAPGLQHSGPQALDGAAWAAARP